MDPFSVGFMTLLACTAIFYIVLFSFIYYWHLVKISFVVVPTVFAFEFFAMGFFIVCIISLVINYLPQAIGAAGF
ncbi:MAG: hypothetical protein NT026_00280 [Candidatus Staskawiczbacteria bacterium]|nr:hypothetical protein [Candidatus Staskawiczbacteria bacterium]